MWNFGAELTGRCPTIDGRALDIPSFFFITKNLPLQIGNNSTKTSWAKLSLLSYICASYTPRAHTLKDLIEMKLFGITVLLELAPRWGIDIFLSCFRKSKIKKSRRAQSHKYVRFVL